MFDSLFGDDAEFEDSHVPSASTGYKSSKNVPPARFIPSSSSTPPHIGLVNLGATCYLNSLLQVLYFTPEFRSGLFQISEDELKIEPVQRDETDSQSSVSIINQTQSDAPLAEHNSSNHSHESSSQSFSSTNGIQNNNTAQNMEGNSDKFQFRLHEGYTLFIEMGFDDGLIEEAYFKYPVSEDPTNQLKLDFMVEFISSGISTVEELREARLKEEKLLNPTNEDHDILHGVQDMAAQVKQRYTNSKESSAEAVTSDSKSTQRWRHVPRELQFLFGLMNAGDATYVGVDGLIKSFNWNSPVYTSTQHDVHELLRILLDVISRSLKGTVQEKLVDRVFMGEQVHVIHCLRCKIIKQVPSQFYDLTLPLSTFGQPPTTSNSIELCLSRYFGVEILEGDNQWRCDNCIQMSNQPDIKSDAHLSYKISQLPPIITLSLGRMEFDFNSGDRVKNKSSVSFPPLLDFAPFALNQTTPAIYELYAVIAHSGSTPYSGHYTSYINDTMSLDNSTSLSDAPDSLDSILDAVTDLDIGSQIIKDDENEDPTYTEGKGGQRKGSKSKKQKHPQQSKGSSKQNNSNQLNHTRSSDWENFWKQLDRKVHARNESTNFSYTSSPSSSSTTATNITSHSLNQSQNHQDHALPSKCNWFWFNDTRVSKIDSSKIASLFGGTDSAYVLYYRRREEENPIASSQLAVTQEAAQQIHSIHSPSSFSVTQPISMPPHITSYVDHFNLEIQKQREESNKQQNAIELNLTGLHDYVIASKTTFTTFQHFILNEGSKNTISSISSRQDLEQWAAEVQAKMLLNDFSTTNFPPSWPLGPPVLMPIAQTLEASSKFVKHYESMGLPFEKELKAVPDEFVVEFQPSLLVPSSLKSLFKSNTPILPDFDKRESVLKFLATSVMHEMKKQETANHAVPLLLPTRIDIVRYYQNRIHFEKSFLLKWKEANASELREKLKSESNNGLESLDFWIQYLVDQVEDITFLEHANCAKSWENSEEESLRRLQIQLSSSASSKDQESSSVEVLNHHKQQLWSLPLEKFDVARKLSVLVWNPENFCAFPLSLAINPVVTAGSDQDELSLHYSLSFKIFDDLSSSRHSLESQHAACNLPFDWSGIDCLSAGLVHFSSPSHGLNNHHQSLSQQHHQVRRSSSLSIGASSSNLIRLSIQFLLDAVDGLKSFSTSSNSNFIQNTIEDESIIETSTAENKKEAERGKALRFKFSSSSYTSKLNFIPLLPFTGSQNVWNVLLESTAWYFTLPMQPNPLAGRADIFWLPNLPPSYSMHQLAQISNIHDVINQAVYSVPTNGQDEGFISNSAPSVHPSLCFTPLDPDLIELESSLIVGTDKNPIDSQGNSKKWNQISILGFSSKSASPHSSNLIELERERTAYLGSVPVALFSEEEEATEKPTIHALNSFGLPPCPFFTSEYSHLPPMESNELSSTDPDGLFKQTSKFLFALKSANNSASPTPSTASDHDKSNGNDHIADESTTLEKKEEESKPNNKRKGTSTDTLDLYVILGINTSPSASNVTYSTQNALPELVSGRPRYVIHGLGRNITLMKFVEKIHKIAGLPPNTNFHRLWTLDAFDQKETMYDNMQTTLQGAGLASWSTVWLEEGAPPVPGHLSVSIPIFTLTFSLSMNGFKIPMDVPPNWIFVPFSLSNFDNDQLPSSPPTVPSSTDISESIKIEEKESETNKKETEMSQAAQGKQAEESSDSNESAGSNACPPPPPPPPLPPSSSFISLETNASETVATFKRLVMEQILTEIHKSFQPSDNLELTYFTRKTVSSASFISNEELAFIPREAKIQTASEDAATASQSASTKLPSFSSIYSIHRFEIWVGDTPLRDESKQLKQCKLVGKNSAPLAILFLPINYSPTIPKSLIKYEQTEATPIITEEPVVSKEIKATQSSNDATAPQPASTAVISSPYEIIPYGEKVDEANSMLVFVRPRIWHVFEPSGSNFSQADTLNIAARFGGLLPVWICLKRSPTTDIRSNEPILTLENGCGIHSEDASEESPKSNNKGKRGNQQHNKGKKQSKSVGSLGCSLVASGGALIELETLLPILTSAFISFFQPSLQSTNGYDMNNWMNDLVVAKLGAAPFHHELESPKWQLLHVPTHGLPSHLPSHSLLHTHVEKFKAPAKLRIKNGDVFVFASVKEPLMLEQTRTSLMEKINSTGPFITQHNPIEPNSASSINLQTISSLCGVEEDIWWDNQRKWGAGAGGRDEEDSQLQRALLESMKSTLSRRNEIGLTINIDL